MVPKSIIKKKFLESIKQELLNSLKENDNVEEPRVNETANETSNPQKALIIIHCYEDIIKTQNKKAIGYIGKHFLDNVGQSRLTIDFKILQVFEKTSYTEKKSPCHQLISEITLCLLR